MGRNSRQRQRSRSRQRVRKGINKEMRKQRDEAIAQASGESDGPEMEFESIDPNTGQVTRFQAPQRGDGPEEKPFDGASAKTVALWALAAAVAMGVIAYILSS